LTICGEQDEGQLRQLYSRCSTYAATSRYEPFGLAPVEAALSKCALIANDIPTFRELWGDSALFFQRNDPDALANAIETLADNPPLRRLYAEEAYERARSRFNSHRMVDEYEDLYKILVRGGRVHEYAAAA
jgi:glycosyltransferase involved in cell wall biosynthesis